MADMKIVFFNAMDADMQELAIDQALPGMNVIAKPIGMDDEEKIDLVKDADFIMLWPAYLADRVLQAAGKCKLVQLLSAGYDQMNLQLAADLGIPVAANGGANSVAVAEHTILLILACYRHLLRYTNSVRAGRWNPAQEYTIDLFELEGKTLGLIGMGNVARQVARRARAFGVNLQYYDKYHQLTPTEEEALAVKRASLEELLCTSDVVSLHVPLGPETRGLIGKTELALMKPTAIIINTSRGGVIAETPLLEALRSGVIAAAGLDVMESEPPDPNDPLLQLDNAIITPHIAGPTLESIPKRAANSFANIQRVWNGEPPLWVAQSFT